MRRESRRPPARVFGGRTPSPPRWRRLLQVAVPGRCHTGPCLSSMDTYGTALALLLEGVGTTSVEKGFVINRYLFLIVIYCVFLLRIKDLIIGFLKKIYTTCLYVYVLHKFLNVCVCIIFGSSNFQNNAQ